MTYVQFVQLVAVITGALWLGVLVLWCITSWGDRLDRNVAGGFEFVYAIVTAVATVILVITTIVLATEHNNRTKDFNYCESFNLRGHETMMLEYNYFNRDCMIKVDGQWLRIDDSAFGRNA